MKLKLAVIPGDGIGPEIVREARKALDQTARKFGHEIEYTELSDGRSLHRRVRRTPDRRDDRGGEGCGRSADGFHRGQRGDLPLVPASAGPAARRRGF